MSKRMIKYFEDGNSMLHIEMYAILIFCLIGLLSIWNR
jgi:hypothetical protein